MHVVTLVGARPQLIKAAALQRAFRDAGLRETLVHTGQHYSAGMSGSFFEELNIAPPAVNLEVGSGSHAVQTAEMMVRLEAYLQPKLEIDGLLVVGDTNTTLAGALVAAKLGLPLFHVEAGLRSGNRRMPEEINRIVTDRLSNLLFCPSRSAADNLNREGIRKGVFTVGDVMRDVLALYRPEAERRFPVGRLRAQYGASFYLTTVHRQENTDDLGRFETILDILGSLDKPVVWPLHPRISALLEKRGLDLPGTVKPIPPVGYLEMISLVLAAKAVLTDSGGLQKEAHWLDRPCVTLRDETEWIETKTGGWNRVTGIDGDRVLAAVHAQPEVPKPELYGDGTAGRLIARLIRENG